MRLLDPSDRLTLAYNEFPLLLAQRRHRTSVSPLVIPATRSVPVAPVLPEPNPDHPISSALNSVAPTTTQASTSGWRRLSLNISGFAQFPGGGDLNASAAADSDRLRGLVDSMGGDVSVTYRHPLQSTNLLFGGFYSLRNGGSLREVSLPSSSSDPVALHSIGAQVALEENTWNPSMRVLMGQNSRSRIYGGLGGSASTWLRASINMFNGGQLSQAHSPIVQISVGNSVPLATLGCPFFGGTYLQASLSLFNSEARLFTSSGALVRASSGSGIPARYEGDYVPPVETQLISLQLTLRGEAPNFNQASATQMDNVEFSRLLISGAVVYYDSARRAILTREAYEASELLQSSIGRSPRLALDADPVLRLTGTEIMDHSLMIGSGFGSWGANITRNWHRMNETQKIISLSWLGAGSAVGLGSIAFFHQGENELRVMAPAMFLAPVQLLTLFIPQNSNMERNITNGVVASVGAVGLVASGIGLFGGDASSFDWNTASATLFNGAANSLINTAFESLIHEPRVQSNTRAAPSNPVVSTRSAGSLTVTGSVNLNRHGGSVGLNVTF